MPVSPRRSVRGSATGRPIMAVLDLLGRRWSLRVLWELRDGPLTFRALQAACDDISPSVLQQRVVLAQLAGALVKGVQEVDERVPVVQDLQRAVRVVALQQLLLQVLAEHQSVPAHLPARGVLPELLFLLQRGKPVFDPWDN